MKQIFLLLYIFLLLSCQSFHKVAFAPTKSTQKTVEAISPPAQITPIKPPTEPIFASVGKTELKNEQISPKDSNDIEDDLEQILFTKRMVLEAKSKGYDKTEDYLAELQTYREILSDAYLTDSTTIKYLLKETYEWMNQEARIAHIMYVLPEFAEPRDTAAIYFKLMDIRAKAMAGEDFGKLANIYSQDKKTNTIGGNIGWFTALQLSYPLEKTAYETPVGQISMPVRSKGGYHIIKVFEKRPYSGEVQVQHLMKIVYPNSADSLKIKKQVDSLYTALKNGANFEELCQKYSDDRKTKNFGGFLPKFSIGKREEPFEKAAFSLKDGEISLPVRTSAGWHILKFVKRYPLESYEAILPKLKDKVVTDSRGELVAANAIKMLKAQNKFVEFPVTVKNAIAEGDTNLFRKKWYYTLDDSLLLKKVFSLDYKYYFVKDFFDFVIDKQRITKFPTGSTPKTAMLSFYKDFTDLSVKNYAEQHLEDKEPEFKTLVEEYKTSLLTTKLLNDRVYDKSVSDTTAQRAYFNQNIGKYAMPERAYASVISTSDAKFFQQIKEILAKGTPYQLKRGIPPIIYSKFASDLTPDIKKKLVGLLSIMRKNLSYIVEVGGHADVSESESTSSERLKNVIKFLTSNGLPLTRIIENDFMKTKPESKTDWTKNARVSFQFFSNSKEDLEKTLNSKNPNAVSIKEGYFKHGENAYLDAISWSNGIHLLEKDGKSIEINIEKIEPARNKTLREARGEVIKGYQADLEKEFKEELLRKYPIKN